ncbi:SDR family NAD(P)-dependent oxidoreductase [Spirosoma sp. HMF4905]|uniref:SDR family NAD(P)-dependent oxidoreductase n=1 Tax=Spirosoma arboris TaxID=2682092 RepID=A0A7K1SLB1_9BACT|nr:oxidoreductase [Spirosoma arboris]MVM34548.1 SDR family NAD(P)-dependent oxidoreductase [Spirosoma arboris]
MNKVVLITGASAGMGKETAKLLAQQGYTVYGAARRTDRMKELTPLGIKTIEMDVTGDSSMVKGVQQIIANEGKLDILINNAGFGSYGAIEDVPITDAKYQLEVNLFGAARLCQLVLPYMRQNHWGKIINISSIGGKMATPFGGWYHASKFALEGLSDSLRNEVKPFGIDVIVIEPGGVKSEWGSSAFDSLTKVSGHTAYKSMATKFANAFEATESKNAEPILIAKLIQKAIEARKPKARYAAGYMARPALFMKKLVSDRLLDKVIMSQIN